ncbi:MAG: hypothetical protein M1154_00125 [Gammaproteobacteria bacterium]|nr:hypothetical protein [Gammaproteobacteria bacterium]
MDIAHQIGCSERTVRRHLAREEAPTGRPARPLCHLHGLHAGHVRQQDCQLSPSHPAHRAAA